MEHFYVRKKFYKVISDMYNFTESAVKLNNEHTVFFYFKRRSQAGRQS
jgi:hypothetical protein